jgi:branched-chain amino acid transport system substrate-binding protein
MNVQFRCIARTRLFRRIAPAVVLALTLGGLQQQARADDVIKLGMTVPMSGAGASWGLNSQWAAQQAVDYVNSHGGVHVGGKTYRFSLTAYDNKYTASDGVRVAQAMFNRDGIRFVVMGISTQAISAAQSISERVGALMMTNSWSNAIKGPKFPLTFTSVNTPTEFIGPLYGLVMKQNPSIKTVVLIRPNDSADDEVASMAEKRWQTLGVKVVGSFNYERGTTEFQPVATQAAQLKPDAIDSLGAPPGDIAMLYRSLADQGWKGVRIASAGTVSDAVIKLGGHAVDGLYMGLGAVFSGAAATPIQRELAAKFEPKFHEPLDLTDVSAWDGVMAVKAGIEKANSLDPRAVARVLPGTVFDSSYGPTTFGDKSVYGIAQQMLLPVIVTQIQNGKVVEVGRIPSAELEQKLAAAH